ncbi:MAG: ABC transporter substrate-binding protein [Candidatus Binatia bacterium]|nr:ABC transporter substrate-binding protein [Candidatus Binatia bacterium]
MRIASLVPAATETVFALGRGDCLVAVSHECDFPEEAKRLPVATRARFDSDQCSPAIDRAVRAYVARGEPLYELDVALLRNLEPETVLVQDGCAVCALPANQLAALAVDWQPAPQIVRLHAHDLAGVFCDIETVATALGCPEEGQALVGRLQAELAAVQGRTMRARYRPRVLCLEWLDPPMVAGNWMPALVEAAGGRPLLAQPGTASAAASWADIAAAAPEVVVLMPCGFPLERTRAELPCLWKQPEWTSLPAVKDGRVYAVDGNAYFNRPGPRIVESARILAGLVQPGLCAHWLPERVWMRVTE